MSPGGHGRGSSSSLLRCDGGTVGQNGDFGYDYDAVSNRPMFLVEVGAGWKSLDPNRRADAGVLINDSPLDLGARADANGRTDP